MPHFDTTSLVFDTTSAVLKHNITHNLKTPMLNINVLIKNDEGTFVESQYNYTIRYYANNIDIELDEPREVRLIVNGGFRENRDVQFDFDHEIYSRVYPYNNI